MAIKPRSSFRKPAKFIRSQNPFGASKRAGVKWSPAELRAMGKLPRKRSK